jgi:hypothetical protein
MEEAVNDIDSGSARLADLAKAGDIDGFLRETEDQRQAMMSEFDVMREAEAHRRAEPRPTRMSAPLKPTVTVIRTGEA